MGGSSLNSSFKRGYSKAQDWGYTICSNDESSVFKHHSRELAQGCDKEGAYLDGFEPHLMVVTNQSQMNDIYDPHYLWIYLHIFFSMIV